MRRRTQRAIEAAAIVTIVLLIVGTVGNMEREDALREHQHYCRMVAEGNWPDYKGILETECPHP